MYERKNFVPKQKLKAEDMNRIEDALCQFSNPNLLINSDFRNPVNQRGKTSYTGVSSALLYTIDRWGIVNVPTVTVQEGCIKVENPSSATYTGRFKQVFENALPNDTYTLSVMVKSNTSDVTIGNFGKINAGFKGLYSHTSATDISFNEVVFYIYSNASIEIEWIKLERGNISTPLIPRHYVEELLLCQRHYYEFDGRVIMSEYTDSNADGVINFPVPMYSVPAATFERYDYYVNSLGTISASAVEVNQNYKSNKYALIKYTKNSKDTFTIGKSINGILKVKFDAEIY